MCGVIIKFHEFFFGSAMEKAKVIQGDLNRKIEMKVFDNLLLLL